MFANELLPALNASVSNSAKIVFVAYAGHANNEGIAWPKTSRICELTGFHSSTVRHARSELVRAGLLKRAGDGVFKVVFPAIAENHPAQNLDMVAPAPVVAKNASTAEPAPVAKPAPAPKPEPVREPVPVATPEPAPEQPTADNPSHVAAPVQQPVVATAPVATPAPMPEPAPAPVAAAPMPALEPAPPTPRHITSARIARLPDVDEAVRREVDARPVVKSSGEKEVDPEIMARAKRLQKLCAENTARSREQKAAAQRFRDGVTAATEQVAKQRAAQDIAAARQRAAQDAAAAKPEQQAAQDAAPPAPVAPVTGQKPEQAATEKTTDGQNADAARDVAVRDGCYPAGEKTNAPEPVAPDAAAAAPIVLPAPVVVQEPQPPAATPQQGELLPAPAKQSRSVKTVAVQGELLPMETKKRATRLPEDWQLPRSWGIWAMEEYGFTEDEVRYHARQFALHWWSSGKRNAYKVNWYMAWQKWIGKEHKDKEMLENRYQQKSKVTQAVEMLEQGKGKCRMDNQYEWNPFYVPTPEEKEMLRRRGEKPANEQNLIDFDSAKKYGTF